jgi:hypothetical protein
LNRTELIEQLADKEHAGWAHWMSYLFSRCNRNEHGELVIPDVLVWHWQRQIDTPYADLPEREKQSDRDEVAKILPIIEKYSGVQRAHNVHPVLTLDDLVYAATARCPCGAGMAYIRDRDKRAAATGNCWDCSAILLDTARTDVKHEARLPFAFYEIKPEFQPSANGQTTRPSQTGGGTQ